MESIAIKNETIRRSLVRVIIGPSIDRVYGSRSVQTAREPELRTAVTARLPRAGSQPSCRDLVDGSLAAIEDRTQLHRGRFHSSHGHLLISVRLRTRWRRSARQWGCRRTSHAAGGKKAAES